MNTTDKIFQEIAGKAREALAARTRIVGIGRDWEARRKAAEETIAAATVAAAHADVQAVIAPEAERAACGRAAETEVARRATAEREQTRLAGAMNNLPRMLLQADEKIEAAYAELSAAISLAHTMAREDLASQIRDLVPQLGRLLQQAHALTAAGVQVGPIRSDINLPNPADMGKPFIIGNRMILDSEWILLNETWRNDPASVALFDRHIQYGSLKNSLASHVRRITDDRRRALEKDNAANRARSFEPGFVPAYLPGDLQPDHIPADTAFDPNAGANTQPAGRPSPDAPLDISVYRKEPLTPAEMNTLWLQKSDGIPWPALDAEFLVMLRRYYEPWRQQFVIESEARAAVLRAKRKRNRDLEATSDRSIMQSETRVTDGTVRVDIGDDDFGSLSRGQIDALWDQSQGKTAQQDPYAAEQTPEFLALSRQMPRRMARRQVENDAHLRRLSGAQDIPHADQAMVATPLSLEATRALRPPEAEQRQPGMSDAHPD